MGVWGGKGDTSSGGTRGNSHLEVRGEVKQRSAPQSGGRGGVLEESWMLRSSDQPKSLQPSASILAPPPIFPSHKPWGEVFPPQVFPEIPHPLRGKGL